jgi:hypothetical protein
MGRQVAIKCITILVLCATLTALSPWAVANPQTRAACQSPNFPKRSVEYVTDGGKISFSFNLARCLPQRSDFVVVGFLDRTGQVGLGPDFKLFRYHECGQRAAVCRFTLRWEHEIVERAVYEVKLFYTAGLDNDRAFGSDEVTLTCDSTPALAFCE